MKRIWFFVCFILLFCCSCKKSIEVTFEQEEGTLVYAINTSSLEIEDVLIEYRIETAEDLFLLYTCYQNRLPLGYTSPANPNISLISTLEKQKIVYYTVDNFILLSNVSNFHEVLKRTGKLLGYTEIHIIFNENELI